MGFDKKIQTVVLDARFFDITKVEERLLHTQQIESPPVQDSINVDPNAPLMSTKRAGPAPEIAGITQWLNTAGKPVTLAELKGKVVIVDFWTYSCINCQRTLPYLKKWHKLPGKKRRSFHQRILSPKVVCLNRKEGAEHRISFLVVSGLRSWVPAVFYIFPEARKRILRLQLTTSLRYRIHRNSLNEVIYFRVLLDRYK
jgi:thiol-disulfide isomerase/thioredoxin